MTPTEKPWKGDLKCYGCPDCGFDAMELDEVHEHWERNHGPIARLSPVLGPNGEPIVVEDERTIDWRTSKMIELQRQEAERLAAEEEREARREAAAIEAIRLEAEEVEAVMEPEPPESVTAAELVGMSQVLPRPRNPPPAPPARKKKAAKKRSRKN